MQMKMSGSKAGGETDSDSVAFEVFFVLLGVRKRFMIRLVNEEPLRSDRSIGLLWEPGTLPFTCT